MGRGIASQNHNPGRIDRKRSPETLMLFAQWHEARFTAVPEGKAVYVKVKDHTGVWRLPCRVILQDGIYRHAEKQIPLAIRVVEWRA